jgi:hypothetical protein
MTKKRVTPSERVLRVMAQHVAYEVNGGVAGYLRWAEHADNLAGEAALLHLRQLIEFLVGRGGPGEVRRNDRDVWPSDWSLAWQVDDAPARFAKLRALITVWGAKTRSRSLGWLVGVEATRSVSLFMVEVGVRGAVVVRVSGVAAGARVVGAARQD